MLFLTAVFMQWLCTCFRSKHSFSCLTTHPWTLLQEGQAAGTEPGQCRGW